MATRQHRRLAAHRHTRRRWLTLLGISALLGMALLVALTQVRARRRHLAAENLLRQTEQRESEQQWLEAAELLEGYLNLHPEASDQRVRLARLYANGAQSGDQRERAVHLLYRALGVCRDDDRLPLRSQLASLLLAAERFSEARVEAGRVLELRPQDAAALRVRGLALLQQYRRGSLDHRISRRLPIVARLEQARCANMHDIELAELAAAAYRNFELSAPGQPTLLQREQLADACLDDLVRARPKDPLAYLARHRYRLHSGTGDADADLQQALAYSANHQTILLAAAEAAQRKAERLCESGEGTLGLAEFGKAADFYRRVVEGNQPVPDPSSYLELGETLYAIGQHSEAFQVWSRGLDKFPNAAASFQSKLADAYLAVNDSRQAEACIIAIDRELKRQELPDRALLSMNRDQSLRRGMWLKQRGSVKPAIEQFQRVITIQEQLGGSSRQTTRAWKQLGEAFALLEQWPESAAAFDYACYEEPQAADLWVHASQSHLHANRFDLAVDRAEQAVRQNPSCLAHLTLATALFRQQPTLLVSQRNWRRVARMLQAAKDRQGDGSIQSGELLASLDRELAEAQKTPETTESRLSLHQLHHQEWPTLHSVHELFAIPGENSLEPRDARSIHEMPFEGVLMLSRIQAVRGEYELAEETLAQSAAIRSPAEQSHLFREIVQHRLARGDVKEAHALLSTLVNKSPDNPALLQLAAEVDIENDHRAQLEDSETFLP